MFVITRITYAEYLKELTKLYNNLCDSIVQKDIPWCTDFCYSYISFSDIVEEVIGTDEYHRMVKELEPYEIDVDINNLLVNRIANDLDKKLGTDKFNIIPCTQFEVVSAFASKCLCPFDVTEPWDSIPFGIGITTYGDFKHWDDYEDKED